MFLSKSQKIRNYQHTQPLEVCQYRPELYGWMFVYLSALQQAPFPHSSVAEHLSGGSERAKITVLYRE